jgi:hypothetical protein
MLVGYIIGYIADKSNKNETKSYKCQISQK